MAVPDHDASPQGHKCLHGGCAQSGAALELVDRDSTSYYAPLGFC